jgi:hypothetical protein
LKSSSKPLPRKILVIEINAFPSVKEKYVKEQKAIDDAWKTLSNGAQVSDVLQHLDL